MAKFEVVRPHQGDRFYRIGEAREAREIDVQHLIPNTLKPAGKKGEPKPLNKAEPTPANKAAPGVKSKARD